MKDIEKIDELIKKSKQVLKEKEEYDGQYKKFDICYILRDKEDIKDYIIIATEGQEIIQIYPYENEIKGIADWAFNIDEDIFGKLENDNKVIEYMNMDMHYGIWCSIEEWYPEDIEYKKGMQEYLKYCKEEGITKEKIEKEIKLTEVNDIMRFYKDKIKNKDDRY